MNLRTITFWVLYVPSQKHIVASRRFKYEIERIHHPNGSVVVKVVGHYVRGPESGGKDG